jgi:hydroxyacylglutathione hydrolase
MPEASHEFPREAAGAGPRPVIEGFVLGPFAQNCYVVRTEGAGGCWIVDPGFDPEEVVERVRELKATPEAIVLTHAHVDHIAGIDKVLRAFPKVPVWVHEAEKEWLSNPMLNLSALSGMEVTASGPDRLLKDGDELTLEGMTWKVLHTPGHSPGSVTFFHAPSSTAIVGDALFAGSIGRTDFPGSDHRTLERAIRARLYTLPDETIVYPGHGPDTTVGHEKRTNPYVRA